MAPGPATVGAVFAHQVTATDPDLTGPEGLSIDARTQDVLWLTTVADAGVHPVVILVRDPRSAAAGLDAVVVLARWLGHPACNAIRAACKRPGIPCVVVTGGKSAAGREVLALVEGR